MKFKGPLLGIVLIAGMSLSGCGGTSEKTGYTGVIDGTITDVPALTGGKILSMTVEEGDLINRGDTIAVVDAADFEYQKEGVRASLNEIAVQESIAKAKIREAQNDSSYIKERYDRILRLYRSNSVPQQQLDDITNRRQRINTSLVQARQNIRLLASRREQLLSQLAIVRKKISDAVVVAPVSGQISVKYFEKGEAVPPLGSVVEVVSLDTVWVKIFVSGSMLPKIQYGQSVQVRADGLERNLPGSVSWISPKAEFNPKNILTPETRKALVYSVKIRVPNREHFLKHGMPVEVYF